MQSDQQLFAKGLATYEKVVAANYMAHKEVYSLLHQVLMNETPDQFVFVDIACGTAWGSADALKGTKVGRYVGIDISQPSIDVARVALAELTCPVDLRCEDFVEAIRRWNEPANVFWIGQSLHHLRQEDKRHFMRLVRGLLPPGGLFLIWEPTCLEGEDREGWFTRFLRLRPEWSAITDEEFAAFDTHQRASDFAETAEIWIGLGRDAGFRRCEELLTVPNLLARVYSYGP